MPEIEQAADRLPRDIDGGILVIADDSAVPIAEDAVAAAHARLLGSVGWDDACRRLDRQGAVAVILADATGIDDMRLAEVLPRLDLLARDQQTRIVATLAASQIDLVAAILAGPTVELLCAPTMTERVTALCLATAVGHDRVQDGARDAEAARLRQLHEEVARIAQTLARLSQNDPDQRADTSYGRTVSESGISYRSQPVDECGPDISARDIREAIRARRLRDQYFGAGLFEDPAWDMLLDLFAAELEHAQVSVSSLCIAAAVAPTTALRWIARMTDAGLFERQPDPFDRRRAFMGLSRRASTGMRSYVAAVRQTTKVLA